MIILKARAVPGWPPLLEATDPDKKSGEGWEQSSGWRLTFTQQYAINASTVQPIKSPVGNYKSQF